MNLLLLQNIFLYNNFRKSKEERNRISYEKIKKSLVMSGIDKIVSESLKINNISDDNSKR